MLWNWIMRFSKTLTMFEYKQNPTLLIHCTLSSKSDGSFIMWQTQKRRFSHHLGKDLEQCVYTFVFVAVLHILLHLAGTVRWPQQNKKKGKLPKRPAPVRTHVPVCVPKITTGQKPCLRRLLLEHIGRTLREEHLSLGNYPPCTMTKMRDSP